ncbi:hypothetical protein MUK42_12448 [Musa troglodytarum]|uniref:Uncharacterized protein n=1 Tax=Musa troglodytarum TaxID=320322 RepID=A0A9E7KTW0_9LILI|nr:hypothetical protein MUK42_12448 [Musa troglodytarum]
MAQTSSGPWILEAAPFFVVVLMVAHVSALIDPPLACLVSRFIGSTGWPPINHPPGRRRTRKDLLISLNDLITPKGCFAV